MSRSPDVLRSPEGYPSPGRIVALGVSLLALGFVIGYGFHTRQSALPQPPTPTPTVAPDDDLPSPPVAKALRLSPDGHTLAFTGVYDGSRLSSRFLLDLKTEKWSSAETPSGWQDYTMGWSNDGSRLLFNREKIPRPVADATSGLHLAKIEKTAAGPQSGEAAPAFNSSELPQGEKSTAGFFETDGRLVIKTRREPKSLYALNGGMRLIGRTKGNFLQTRAVRENGRSAIYVVRDVDGGEPVALYRIADGKETRLCEPLNDVVWAYVSDNADWMIACRHHDNGTDWKWTLYKVTPNGARMIRSNTVPGDVIGVFWSPDRKYILGASGQSLWTIEIPSLQVRRVGTRRDWKADDAVWLQDSKAIIVASKGSLWNVQIPSGEARQIWKFPDTLRQ